MDILVELDTPSLMQIVQTLTTSLDSLEAEVSSQASYALDFFATYYVRNVKKDSSAMTALRRHLAAQPQLFEALMKLVFHIVVFGEIGRSWSLPKPLLSLILAAELVRPNVREHHSARRGAALRSARRGAARRCEQRSPPRLFLRAPLLSRPPCALLQVFEEFKNEVVAMQPGDVQQRMQDEFQKLMKDITRSLDPVNRDRFQNRITIFLVSVREFAKIL